MSATASTEDIVKERDNDVSLNHYMDVPEPYTEKLGSTATKRRKHRDLIKLAIKIATILLIWAHFAWATYYFVTYSKLTLDETTCSGYGLHVILFCFINFGICYKFLLKPFVIPVFKRFVWVPTANLLSKIKYGSIIFYILVLVAVIIYLVVDTADDRRRLISVGGLCAYILFSFIISAHKKMIPWHTIIWGLILQFVFGLLTIRWQTGRNIFDCLGNRVNIFLGYAVNGSAFVYSDNLVLDPDNSVFAFRSLATIYFLAFIINILYYYGLMQKVVGALGRFLEWIMGTSICESVNSAANIFLGQTEAPLLLKPYLIHLTDSEIHSIMTSGFATVSGTVLAAYISFGASPAHLITSSVMSAPAALCMSKLIYPETEEIVATKDKIKATEVEFDSVMDAASKGAHDASNIVLAIIANLIAFIAFVYFINGVLSWLGALVGYTDPSEQWTVDLILGKIFTPISYIMGVPWDECEKVGTLIGIKTMVNEFVAFQRMGQMTLTPKSKLIATYSICGFANPGSIGMMISTLGTLIPKKREAVTRLVFRAFLGGCIACFMTACIAATLISQDSNI